jgi:hypothetical protein
MALWEVGQRESGTIHLVGAANHLRLALEEQTRVRSPLNWATTENNLRLVLWRLGEREAGTERLVEAVVTLQLALEERTRDRVPLDWAQTQNNLGLVLWRLGQREAGIERLKVPRDSKVGRSVTRRIQASPGYSRQLRSRRSCEAPREIDSTCLDWN